jgi:prevent-host-death family protein
MDDASRSPAKKINAMEARRAFGRILEEVFYKGEQYIIERAGKPMAAVVPLSQLEELQNHSGEAKTEHDTMKSSKRYSKKRRGRA